MPQYQSGCSEEGAFAIENASQELSLSPFRLEMVDCNEKQRGHMRWALTQMQVRLNQVLHQAAGSQACMAVGCSIDDAAFHGPNAAPYA